MLSTELAGVPLRNPTILAAGLLGTSASILKRVADSGAAAVTLKSIGPRPRGGNPNPTVLCWGEGLINAVGLPSPGYQNMGREWDELKEKGLTVHYVAKVLDIVDALEADGKLDKALADKVREYTEASQ